MGARRVKVTDGQRVLVVSWASDGLRGLWSSGAQRRVLLPSRVPDG